MFAGLVIAFLLILWVIIDIGMPMSDLSIPEPLQITIAFFIQHLPQILFILDSLGRSFVHFTQN